ncbi:MAG TPA: MaoC/PaaZ C-terminal domain-containing protein [Kineosporiaceae bacterium]|nr:MaoC/PaaZ C-terminal domain-containing protein [Kineosporiaceae bacterium]
MTDTTRPRFDTVTVGDELPPVNYPVQRVDLIRYAGASGDFNVIHWNERVATSVGLPNVIAHGMFTMATGGRFVSDWVGDPGAIAEYGVRFTSMVPVPDDDQGATIEVSGRITAKNPDARTVTVQLSAVSAGQKVLGKASAVVRLP